MPTIIQLIVMLLTSLLAPNTSNRILIQNHGGILAAVVGANAGDKISLVVTCDTPNVPCLLVPPQDQNGKPFTEVSQILGDSGSSAAYEFVVPSTGVETINCFTVAVGWDVQYNVLIRAYEEH